MSQPHLTFRPRIWAQLGEDLVDVRACEVTFALNQIPRCSLRMPLGRAVRFSDRKTIHDITQELESGIPVKVFLDVQPTESDTGHAFTDFGLIPECPMLLFEGETTGASYSRRSDEADLVLRVSHWLEQLAESSMLSYECVPENPTQYTYGALMPGDRDGSMHLTGLTDAFDLITPAAVASDFWGTALLPFMQKTYARNLLHIPGLPLPSLAPNSRARAALDRFATPGSDGYVALGTDKTVGLDVCARISQVVSTSIANPQFLAGTSGWDLLVGRLGPEFKFSVVPTVKSAFVVPFFPGNRGIHRDLPRLAYWSAQDTRLQELNLRGVGIMAHIGRHYNETLPSGGVDADVAAGLGGWYDSHATGQYLFLQAPSWLQGWTVPAVHANSALRGAVANAVIPSGGSADPEADATKRIKQDFVPLLDRYAQMAYRETVLRHRACTLTGPLRVDIAPGSTVQLEGVGNDFISSDSFERFLFGEVLQVTIQIDGEAPSAATAFHIGHLRSLREHLSEATSAAKHPLWTRELWTGCPLIVDCAE